MLSFLLFIFNCLLRVQLWFAQFSLLIFNFINIQDFKMHEKPLGKHENNKSCMETHNLVLYFSEGYIKKGKIHLSTVQQAIFLNFLED